MKAIIKSGEQLVLSAVRPVDRVSAYEGAQPPLENPFAPLERRIEELEAAFAERDITITTLREDVRKARAEGEAKGRERGLREAEDRQADRLALLEKAITAGRARLDDSLADTAQLAAALARDCLDKLFGNPDFRAEAVEAILRVQMARLTGEARIAITVSAADFPDQALAGLVRDGVTFASEPDMPSGGCVLKPRLGEIDIGLDTQWQAVRALLDDLAEGARQ